MSVKKKKILFYYLSAFSNTGGIEKFNRCFIKALNELSGDQFSASIVSVYDQESDPRYNSKSAFRGFYKKRGRSVAYIISKAWQFDVFIVGHINLAVAGFIVKLINPKCRLIVVAHGIEVWGKLYFFKKWCLRKADVILAVSNYTKNQLVLQNGLSPSRIKLFPNTIDPFFSIPTEFTKPSYLLERYGLTRDQPVILTLSRLLSSEKYKGYDTVISALPSILQKMPRTMYILAGKYDSHEKQRIEKLIELYQVKDHVILPGFIAEEEMPDHYRAADVFIMPSRKEGFGIVFLEALACGTNVIGGNQDGTVDALHNGALGKLINPRKITEIAEAVVEEVTNGNEMPEVIQKNVLEQYRFLRYKNRLGEYLLNA